MKHLKRQRIPKSWPIPRKGTKFVVKTSSKGISVLIALRDILKLAQDRKEVKKAISKKEVLINGKHIKEEKKELFLFDILTIPPSKKNYHLVLTEKGKFGLDEIKNKEDYLKIVKVVGKKTLKKKRNQLNFSDGKNLLSNSKVLVNDSVILNLKENKIEEVLPLKEKSKILIFGGKHTGKKGILKEIDKKTRSAQIEMEKELKNVLIKQLMVIKWQKNKTQWEK